MARGPEVHGTFIERLARGIEPLVPDGAKVVLAVSGGPDSLAMLVAWSELAAARVDSVAGHELTVAHFDHRLRPDSADDARFVEGVCSERGLPFIQAADPCSSPQRPSGWSEGSARKARYAFLTDAARRFGARFVATAHTADDQVETVLAAIARGTGLHGLAGMPRRRVLAPGIEVVRPMLDLSRCDVVAFLEERTLVPRHDSTNGDLSKTRNRIRHELLPLLRRHYNPRIDDAVLRLAGLARESAALVRRRAQELLDAARLEATDSGIRLALEPLRSADRHLAAEAIRLALEQAGWPRQHLGFTELQRIVAFVHDPSARPIDLPHAIRARRTRGTPPSLELVRRGPVSPVPAQTVLQITAE